MKIIYAKNKDGDALYHLRRHKLPSPTVATFTTFTAYGHSSMPIESEEAYNELRAALRQSKPLTFEEYLVEKKRVRNDVKIEKR